MPGSLLAVLTGTFEVRGGLRVLAPPYRPGPDSRDGVGSQDSGGDSVADSGSVVAELQGIFRGPQELAGLGKVGSGVCNAC